MTMTPRNFPYGNGQNENLTEKFRGVSMPKRNGPLSLLVMNYGLFFLTERQCSSSFNISVTKINIFLPMVNII